MWNGVDFPFFLYNRLWRSIKYLWNLVHLTWRCAIGKKGCVYCYGECVSDGCVCVWERERERERKWRWGERERKEDDCVSILFSPYTEVLLCWQMCCPSEYVYVCNLIFSEYMYSNPLTSISSSWPLCEIIPCLLQWRYTTFMAHKSSTQIINPDLNFQTTTFN